MNVKLNSKEKNNFFHNKFLLLVVGLIIFIIIVLILIISYKPSDTYKIAKKISSEYPDSTIVEESGDPRYNYSYQESVLIYTEELGDVKSGNYAISISKYNSNMEAKYKKDFLENQMKLLHEKLDNTFVSKKDDYESKFFIEKNIKFVKGTYLIIINSKLKDKERVKKSIEELLDGFDIKDNLKSNEDEIKEYWKNQISLYSYEIEAGYSLSLLQMNEHIKKYADELDGCKGSECSKVIAKIDKFEIYDDLKESIAIVKSKYNDIIKAKENKVYTINNLIQNLKNSLNQEEYDLIKKQIEEITKESDSYYDDYVKNWNMELNNLEEPVYKKGCTTYNYKDLLRNPDNYVGKKAYFFGKVLQKVSDTQYRVGVDCTKYHYINDYSCDNTIYVGYYGDKNIIEDDIIEIWGSMSGNKTYTTIMGSTVTIPSLYAKYIVIK